jgi:hypothetical protein
MGATRLTRGQVERLANDVRDKLLAREVLVAESAGKLTIDTYPRGEGFDIELTLKVR